MSNRSQRHKQHYQHVASDGSTDNIVALDHALVDQAGTANVDKTYAFAANSFSSKYGPLRYTIASVVTGVVVNPLSGITFVESTRTITVHKGAGTYTVRVTAMNEDGYVKTDDVDFVIT